MCAVLRLRAACTYLCRLTVCVCAHAHICAMMPHHLRSSDVYRHALFLLCLLADLLHTGPGQLTAGQQQQQQQALLLLHQQQQQTSSRQPVTAAQGGLGKGQQQEAQEGKQNTNVI